MKKYFVILLLITLVLTSLAAGVKFSLLTFYTTDLQTGSYNVWPIAYLNVPLTSTIGLRFEDYVMGSHKTFKIGNFNFMEPTYWYATYRSGNVSAYIGSFKSKHTLARQMYLLRVGGFYNTLTGAEVDFKNYTYDLGLMYDWKYSEISAFTGLEGNNYKIYLYVSKGNKITLSTNASLYVNSGNMSAKFWGAAAYDVDPAHISFGMPTVLIGGKTYFKSFEFSAQFADQPNSNAAKIWYDYNDPNKAGYPLKDFNSLFTYKLNRQNSIGVLANWNSNLITPTFGFQLTHGDLSLSVGNGDLNGGISGTQYVMLSYSNYFSIPLTTSPLFSSDRRW